MNSITNSEPAQPQYAVVWPLGRLQVDAGTEFPKSLPDLNGATIGEMWDWLYKGDSLFPIVREELRKRYPDIKFVEYPVIGNIHGPDENEIVQGLPQLLQALGCDAVVVGVGH